MSRDQPKEFPLPADRWVSRCLAGVVLVVFGLGCFDAWALPSQGIGLRSALWQASVGALVSAPAHFLLALLLLAPWWLRRANGPLRAVAEAIAYASVLWPWWVVRLHASPLYDSIRSRTQLQIDVALGAALVVVLGLTLGILSRRMRLAPPRALWLAVGTATLAMLGVATALHFSRPSRPAASESANNVVLVVFDTLRLDAMGHTGNPLAESPHLDAMASEGLWLGGLVANGATSLPGHASILTGLGAQEHGAITNKHSLKVGVETMAQDFARRGYRTAGVCRNQLISREAGFDRGFDSYWSTDHPLTGQAPVELVALRVALAQLALKGTRADLTTRYGRAHLRRGEAPFFLFLQYLTCHTPYDDRHGWATGERVAQILELYENGTWTNTTDYPLEEVAEFHARYLGSVFTADRIVGDLRETLRERGLEDDTVILVTSDHGENLAEHGHRRIGHHSGPFETSLRVPLVASVGPGDSPAAYRELTGQDRIAALALALATPETSPTSERDLDRILRKDRHFAFVESHAVLYDDSLKTVVDLQRPELGAQVFRWREDGNDRTPQPVGPSDARAQELEQILRENQIREALSVEVELTPERERALRALGYIE